MELTTILPAAEFSCTQINLLRNFQNFYPALTELRVTGLTLRWKRVKRSAQDNADHHSHMQVEIYIDPDGRVLRHRYPLLSVPATWTN